MIDLSDGLLRDGHRVAAASGVRSASPRLRRTWRSRRAVGTRRRSACSPAARSTACWRRSGDVPTVATIGVVEAGEGVTLDGRPDRARLGPLPPA